MAQRDVIEIGDMRLAYDDQQGEYVDTETGAVVVIEPFLDDAMEWVGGKLGTAGKVAGGIVGGALGGPFGAVGGAKAGEAAGDFVGNFIGGGDQTAGAAGAPPDQFMQGDWGGFQGPTQGAQSGGAGAGSSYGAPPAPPAGAQGGELVPGGRYDIQTMPDSLQSWLRASINFLFNSPWGKSAVREMARTFGFVRGRSEAPDSQCTAALAKTLSPPVQKALHQFTCGFPAPIDLPKAGREAFMAMKIAQSGHSAQTCAPNHCK